MIEKRNGKYVHIVDDGDQKSAFDIPYHDNNDPIPLATRIGPEGMKEIQQTVENRRMERRRERARTRERIRQSRIRPRQ